jgi:hypothetical protein
MEGSYIYSKYVSTVDNNGILTVINGGCPDLSIKVKFPTIFEGSIICNDNMMGFDELNALITSADTNTYEFLILPSLRKDGTADINMLYGVRMLNIYNAKQNNELVHQIQIA